MYNKKVMEIFQNPKNVGLLHNANAIGIVGNARCGDIMKLYLRIKDGIIEDASFKTFGCAAAIVSTSIATEKIKGKTIEQALAITNQEIVDELGGLPAIKIHCSVLAKEAIEAAINDYYERQRKEEKKSKKSSKNSSDSDEEGEIENDEQEENDIQESEDEELENEQIEDEEIEDEQLNESETEDK